jgi:hypothetical protein
MGPPVAVDVDVGDGDDGVALQGIDTSGCVITSVTAGPGDDTVRTPTRSGSTCTQVTRTVTLRK